MLSTVHPEEHLYEVPEELESSRRNSSFSSVTLRKKGKYISSYKIEEKYAFKVCFITNLNVNSAEVRCHKNIINAMTTYRR